MPSPSDVPTTLVGLAPDRRTGSDPWRFDPVLQSLGADPANNDYGPLGMSGLFFRLAEGLGIGLPYADLREHPVLCAQLEPLVSERT